MAGLAILSVVAQAAPLNAQIVIDRALNSPTLTIRYTNASAALVELRVNGESVATRNLAAERSSGETSFSLTLANLRSGDNDIEVRLFDVSGKLLGTQRTSIQADESKGPVYFTNPKMGATIIGPVEIKVGFAAQMKNSYVSFFIDNQFKSISNVAPFSYVWDSTLETNGWHELEAWLVDDTSATYKTRKVRIFINNPSGHSPRLNLEKPTPKPTAKPAVSTGEWTLNPIKVSIAGTVGTKPAQFASSVPTGPKAMVPTGKRLIASKMDQKLPPMSVTNRITSASSMVRITKGQRLPNIGAFTVVFNTQFVNFDVQPRVENGVPLTPFRHLIEKAGGMVLWEHLKKNVDAKADGHNISLHIGDAFANINKHRVELEHKSFIDSGRTIVPLSFMRDALNVNIEFDKATNHVLITSSKK